MLPTPVFSLLACGSKNRANPNLTVCIQFIKKVIGSWSEYLNQKRAGRPSKARVNGTAVAETVEMQQRLADLGYYESKADGAFGRGSRASLKAFRLSAGLGTDSRRDMITRKALFRGSGF